MEHSVTELPPTSDATTGLTEPEVVAGIASAEGSPDLPTDIRVDHESWSLGGVGRAVALLALGAVIGFGAQTWWRRSD
jgi:hypothetical protein